MRVTRSGATIQHYIARYNMADFLNENLLDNLQLFHFPAYTNIYIEQQEQHFLYFLVQGNVQCSHYHLNGKLAVIAVSSPFAAIGDLEILSEERVYSNVVATQDTIMLGIAREIVHRYGAHDPRFLRFLLDQVRQKLYRTNTLQASQTLPVINRLAVYVLTQAANGAHDGVLLPGKEELGSLLGTTTRHLNRVLKELVESGAISAGYPLVRILDRTTLQQFTL